MGALREDQKIPPAQGLLPNSFESVQGSSKLHLCWINSHVISQSLRSFALSEDVKVMVVVKGCDDPHVTLKSEWDGLTENEGVELS